MRANVPNLGQVSLTLNQIDDMRHAIGFEPSDMRKGQRRYAFQRNYFVACRPEPEWEDLVARGFAEVRDVMDGRHIYYAVTPEGVRVLEDIFRIDFEESR